MITISSWRVCIVISLIIAWLIENRLILCFQRQFNRAKVTPLIMQPSLLPAHFESLYVVKHCWTDAPYIYHIDIDIEGSIHYWNTTKWKKNKQHITYLTNILNQPQAPLSNSIEQCRSMNTNHYENYYILHHYKCNVNMLHFFSWLLFWICK